MNVVDLHPRWRSSAPPALRLIALAAVLLAFSSASVLAEAGSNEFGRGTKDVFSISLGTFLMNFDTKARLDSIELGRGTDIDAENDLGFPTDQTRVRLDGYWRFARKHRLEFGGYFFRKTKDRTAEEQIQWGDHVYNLSAGLHSDSSVNVYKIAYKYSFVRKEKWEAGASFGITAMDASLTLSGEATLDGTSEGFASEGKSAVAPIPLIGIHGEWKFADKWYLKGSGEWLNIDVDKKEGNAKDIRVTVNWYPFTHWGFGAGYNLVNLSYEDSSEPAYKFEYGYEGLLLYATYVY